ncbi:MAG: hypothetical protein WD556_00025 [Actinomycetota bacterium]
MPAAAVAIGVFIAAGVFAYSKLGPVVDPRPAGGGDVSIIEGIPTSVRVICREDATYVDAPEVRPSLHGARYGVEFRIHVPPSEGGIASVRWLDLWDEHESSGIGGGLDRHGRVVLGADPGRFEVSCSGADRKMAVPAPISVVDPEGLWISPELSCADPPQVEVPLGTTPVRDEAEAVAGRLPGLLPGDEVIKPGYPTTSYKLGPLFIVQRGGQVVGRFTVLRPPRGWIAVLQACEGSGLGMPSPPDDAAGGIADVAQLSCTDGGTQTTTPVVRAHPDGVHLVVEDLTGRFDDLGMQELGDPWRQLFAASDRIDDEFVRPLMPGRIYAQCLRKNDDQQQFKHWATGDPLPPEAVVFDVVDPDGVWVATELSCDVSQWEAVLVGDPVDGSEGMEASERLRLVGGVRSTDSIESAGYPEDEQHEYRVVRGAEVVAQFSSAEPFLVAGWACRGSGINGT